MWGSLLGLAVSGVGSAIAATQSAKKANEAKAMLDKQEQTAKNNYNYVRGLSEAGINSTLTRNRENLMEQLGYATALDRMGNTNNANRIRQGALATSADAGAQAAQIRANADMTAYQTYQGALNDIDKSRIAVVEGERQGISQAGSDAMKAGMGLVQSDVSTYLEKGKGLFELAFGKKDKK